MTASVDHAIRLLDALVDVLDAEAKGVSSAPVKPAASAAPAATTQEAAPAGAPAAPATAKPSKKEKKSKQKQDKGEQAAKKPWLKDAPATAEATEPITQADLRVARVLEVEAVENSDKLWRCQVDVGEDKPRQVVAGLQQYISKETMEGLTVVTICNLKAAKLAGQMSEAMILAASFEEGGTRTVATLRPPQDSQPGDQVFVEGGQPHDATPKVLKSKVWQEVIPKLKAVGGKPCHDGSALRTLHGACTLLRDMPDGSGIN